MEIVSGDGPRLFDDDQARASAPRFLTFAPAAHDGAAKENARSAVDMRKVRYRHVQ
jgi:hypothetical protein